MNLQKGSPVRPPNNLITNARMKLNPINQNIVTNNTNNSTFSSKIANSGISTQILNHYNNEIQKNNMKLPVVLNKLEQKLIVLEKKKGLKNDVTSPKVEIKIDDNIIKESSK